MTARVGLLISLLTGAFFTNVADAQFLLRKREAAVEVASPTEVEVRSEIPAQAPDDDSETEAVIPFPRPAHERPAPPANDLNTMNPASLFDGSIPSMKHLDTYYETHNRTLISTRSGRAIYTCRGDWRRLREKRVVPRSIAANLDTLEKNARDAGLPVSKLKRALASFLKNKNEIPNQRYLTVIDFNKSDTKKRMFIIDLLGGEGSAPGSIKSYQAAHGMGSDPNNDGIADRFSDEMESKRSSLGCAIATYSQLKDGTKLYDGDGRHKLLLQGIETSNDASCERLVFMHPASYVAGGGRSHGCPAVKTGEKQEIYDKISGGGMVCSYHDS